MQKSLYITNPDKCTGCMQCGMAYNDENYGIFNPSQSRIKVFEFHRTGKKVPCACTQCDEAWCLDACLVVDAIRLDAQPQADFMRYFDLYPGVAADRGCTQSG